MRTQSDVRAMGERRTESAVIAVSPRDSQETNVAAQSRSEQGGTDFKGKERLRTRPLKREEGALDDDEFLVTLDARDDPKRMRTSRKWTVVLVVCSGAMCATCASSMVRVCVSRALVARRGSEHSRVGGIRRDWGES